MKAILASLILMSCNSEPQKKTPIDCPCPICAAVSARDAMIDYEMWSDSVDRADTALQHMLDEKSSE